MQRSKQRKEAAKLGGLRAFPEMLPEKIKARAAKTRQRITRRVLTGGPR